MAGCASTVSFGYLVNLMGISNNPVSIGRLLAGFGTVGYLGSAVSWYFARKYYRKVLENE